MRGFLPKTVIRVPQFLELDKNPNPSYLEIWTRRYLFDGEFKVAKRLKLFLSEIQAQFFAYFLLNIFGMFCGKRHVPSTEVDTGLIAKLKLSLRK